VGVTGKKTSIAIKPAGDMVFRFLLLVVVIFASGAASSAFADNCPAAPPTSEGGSLNRLAYAVDEVESRHGADPGMWRADPNGPQGPMQVSAAAATDAGGGDRFDKKQNHALGCSYLARLYRRYGSWPDAIAAYNWGPGRLDKWINGGRPIDKFPASVDRYRTRVLMASALPGADIFGSINARLARLRMLRLQAKQQLAERHRRGNRTEAVDRLYAEIMRATDPELQYRLRWPAVSRGWSE
jgi:Transglycosylase SLT domain